MLGGAEHRGALQAAHLEQSLDSQKEGDKPTTVREAIVDEKQVKVRTCAGECSVNSMGKEADHAPSPD